MTSLARTEAKAAGEIYYFTGKPCKRGHNTERYVSTGHCVECVAINAENFSKANPEKRKAAREKYLSNPNNRERDNEHKRNWKKRNPITVRAYWHRQRAAEGEYTEEDIQNLFLDQFGSCAGCQRYFTDKLKFTVDHIVPLSKGGTNWPSNIQLLCGSCNYSKGAKDMNEWLIFKGYSNGPK